VYSAAFAAAVFWCGLTGEHGLREFENSAKENIWTEDE